MHRSRASLLAALFACGGPQAAAPPPACPTGAVTLAGPDDVAAFATCKTAGSLVIRTGAELDLKALGALESVAGDLVVGPSFGLEELALRGLRRIGGTLRVASNNNLRGVYLPALEQVAAIDVGGNAALTTISMPRLASVAGALAVVGNPGLEMLDVTSLVAVGGELALADSPALTLVEAGALASTKSTRIENTGALATDVIEALRAKAP